MESRVYLIRCEATRAVKIGLAIDPATLETLPLRIPAPDIDAAWSPTLDPITPADVALCRGKGRVHAAPKAARAARGGARTKPQSLLVGSTEE